jgi:hypothetical protein
LLYRLNPRINIALFYLEIGRAGGICSAYLIPSQTAPLDWERKKERFLKIGAGNDASHPFIAG